MIDFNAYVDVNMIEKNESLVFNVCQLLDSHHKIKTYIISCSKEPTIS